MRSTSRGACIRAHISTYLSARTITRDSYCAATIVINGGGAAIVDPRDERGLATLESVFEFELELPREVPHDYLGSHVHVRFEHSAEPVGWRLWRGMRRAFLSHFQV